MSTSAPTYIYPPLDADPNTLYQGFVTFMQSNIPGWKAYSGQLDDWLARAFAGIQASLTEVASDVATQIYRWFGANIVNTPPFNAQAAIGAGTITVQDGAGYTIPAFTQMSFPDASGNLQGFETLTDTVIAPSSTSATDVFMQAMTAGAAGNGCSGAGDLDGSTPITYITGLTMTTTSNGGADAESDSDYLNRLTALFTTLTPTPITNAQFTIIASTQPSVGRATTISTFNPGTWTLSGTLVSTSKNVTVGDTSNIPVGAPVTGTDVPANTYVASVTSGTVFVMSAAATGSTATTLTFTGQLNQGGFVTTWVTAADGSVLSSPIMATIQAAIQAQCLSNVNYFVEAPTQTTIAINADVFFWPGVDTTAGGTAVSAALTNYLEPANFGLNNNPTVSSGPPAQGWLNDPTVRVISVENVMMNVPGVHYVANTRINTVAADFNLPGVVPLTQPGTIALSVANG